MFDAQQAVARPSDYDVEETPFGRLVWMVSGKLGNSETMTVGKCHIEPGRSNPRHYHPNCDEVLYVVRGTIEHSVENEVTVMHPGDVVSIPSGRLHNARNIGEDEVELLISFSAPDRQTVGE
ncbi:quercetin dioxygenase-like cupin family protein [Pseudonocardia kunmingensis]|uniref:Quercetin dioxygenase-like cupin family protein n=1 Tax=Pseudonocardia kunmingensis TaxID=630975 RepID=A0A543DQD7_9PSEU|nr:quercetin dioxygenase-like cupin family protein [Pseudonocardia kunmingensis]